MFSSMKGFVSRHRRKLVVTGVVIGGTVMLVRYVQKKLRNFQEQQAKEFIEKTRRMQHFESTEKTCNQAIVGLSTSLCDEIIKLLNTDDILEKLRKNDGNKVDLWQDLKVMSFTRLTTLIYATTIFVITLRVQLNILGGYLYRDTVSEDAKISDDVRQSYLSLVQVFMSDGLTELSKLIESKVKIVLESYPLTKKLSLSEIEQIFWSIQMAVNSDAQDPNSNIARYVLPKELNSQGILAKMFNETLDVLESDDVSILCSNSISRGFSIAVDNIAEFYTETAKSNEIVNNENAASTSKVQLNSVVNINNLELHLAKLIPILSGLTARSYENNTKPPNLTTSLVTFFLISEKIKVLGANVYEVFSI